MNLDNIIYSKEEDDKKEYLIEDKEDYEYKRLIELDESSFNVTSMFLSPMTLKQGERDDGTEYKDFVSTLSLFNDSVETVTNIWIHHFDNYDGKSKLKLGKRYSNKKLFNLLNCISDGKLNNLKTIEVDYEGLRDIINTCDKTFEMYPKSFKRNNGYTDFNIKFVRD